MATEKIKFPLLKQRLHQTGPNYVKWECLNEDWAQTIHGQSLQQLAARGGLSVVEIGMNVERKKWGDIRADQAWAIVNEIGLT